MTKTYLSKGLLVGMLFVAVVGGMFCALPRHAEAAFGISPPYLNADHLTPGATYSQTLYLVRDNASSDLAIVTDLSLPSQIQSWITVDQGSHFVIPAGNQQFPVTITITVPPNAPLNKYTGSISFTTAPSQAGQVTIALGVDVALNLTVGNNVFEQFVVTPSIPDIEEGMNPRAYVAFNNQGNIPEAFDIATFEIFDQFDAVRLAYLEKQDGFPATPPFKVKDYTVEFPSNLHLGPGEYWGNVVFYQNDKVVASQKASFRVLPVGSLTGWWGIVMYFIANNMWVVWVVALLVAAGIGFLIRHLLHKKFVARMSVPPPSAP